MAKAITLQNVKVAVAALNKAEAATGDSNAARTAATQSLYSTVAGYFVTDKAANVDLLLPVVYGDKWEEFNGNVQKSRKTEWNTLATVAKAGRADDCIAAASEAKNFLASVRKALTYVKANEKATPAQIKAHLEAKAEKVAANDGDIFESVMAEATDLYKRYPETFAKCKAHFAGLQAFYNSERAMNRLRTNKELGNGKAATEVVDFSA